MTETSTESTNEETSWDFKLSEGLVITAIPLVAYLFIFVFESGYLSTFGIPPEFISFDLAEVIGASGALLFFGFFLFSLLDMLSRLFVLMKLPPVIAFKIATYVPFALLLLSNLILFEFTKFEWYFWGAVFIVLLIADFIYPIFAYSNIKPYLGKLARDHEIISRSKPQTLLSRLLRSLGKNRVKVIFYFILILYLTFRTGQSLSLHQENYFTLNTNTDTAVLYISRNQAIVAPFNRSTQELQPSFSVVDFSQHPDLTFTKEKIGKLHIRTSQNNP